LPGFGKAKAAPRADQTAQGLFLRRFAIRTGKPLVRTEKALAADNGVAARMRIRSSD
jgi:hypothetical protein